jgi:hypothetical protein
VPVGLVSNSPRSFVESGLRSAGLEGAFAVLVTGEEVRAPSRRPMRTSPPRWRWRRASDARCEDSPTGWPRARRGAR